MCQSNQVIILPSPYSFCLESSGYSLMGTYKTHNVLLWAQLPPHCCSSGSRTNQFWLPVGTRCPPMNLVWARTCRIGPSMSDIFLLTLFPHSGTLYWKQEITILFLWLDKASWYINHHFPLAVVQMGMFLIDSYVQARIHSLKFLLITYLDTVGPWRLIINLSYCTKYSNRGSHTNVADIMFFEYMPRRKNMDHVVFLA